MDDDNHNECSKEDGDINVQSSCCDGPGDDCQVAEDHLANIDADAKNNCADACCPSQDQNNDDPVTPPECCDGTTDSCCGDACIDRLALRACNGKKQQTAPLPSYEGMFASRYRGAPHQAHDVDWI